MGLNQGIGSKGVVSMRTLIALSAICGYLWTSDARAATCDDLGLYAFALAGCPHYDLTVDLKTPLCQQEKLKHLAYLDWRCYVEVPQDDRCTSWDCPAPYDKVMREPISGKIKIVHGSRELVDWYYRAARNAYGAAMRQIPKKNKRK